MIFSWISFSCPLILASFGALISEYAGCLAMFMEGLISLAAFLTYTFTWNDSFFNLLYDSGNCLLSCNRKIKIK